MEDLYDKGNFDAITTQLGGVLRAKGNVEGVNLTMDFYTFHSKAITFKISLASIHIQKQREAQVDLRTLQAQVDRIDFCQRKNLP